MKLGAYDSTARKGQQRPDERFGRFLVRHGVVPPDVLEATAESQVIFGRRLGTTLLELGHLGEAELEQQLSAYLEAPLPPADWLAAPAPDALAALPAELADELGALPLRNDGGLHVAMLDPHDPATLDAIQQASGRRVVPYVLCERRLRALLEQHLGILQRQRAIEVEPIEDWRPVPPAPRAEPKTPPSDREALGLVPLPAETELIDRATFEEIHQASLPATEADAAGEAPKGSARAVSPQSRLGVLEAALTSAEEHEHAVEAALLIARRYADAAALFAVGEEEIRAVGVSTPDRREAAREISVPASADCILSTAATSGLPYRGELVHEGIDGLVFHALGRQRAREALVLPVRLESRVVNLLCVDAGPDPFPATAEAALRALSELLGQTYERLIQEKALRYR